MVNAIGNIISWGWLGSGRAVSQFEISSVQPGTINQVSITFKVAPTYQVTIDFGDGAGEQTITANGHDATLVSNYVTNNTTYPITISGQLSGLKKLSIISEATVAFNINDLSNTGLTYLHLQSTGTITGSINNLPSTLCYLHLQSVGASVTGDPSSLPDTLARLVLDGVNTLSGNIDSLPPNIYYLELETITAGLTGSISNLPTEKLNFLWINNTTTFTGLIDDLSENLTYVRLFGIGNSITGSLDNIQSTTLQGFILRRTTSTGGTYTGSINSFAAQPLVEFYVGNLGASVTGDIESLPASLNTTLTITNAGSINYGAGTIPAWAALSIVFTNNLTTADVDAFLISWATTAGAGTETVNLAGTNQARSAASDAAVTTLTGLGKTITTT